MPATVDSNAAMLEKALAGLLTRRLGHPVSIERLCRLSGGASRETWSFDAVPTAGERLPLILRRDFPHASPAAESDSFALEALDRLGEYELFRALHAAGLPVPRPVAWPDPESGLRDCFVMERLEGEALPRRILREPTYERARERLTGQLGAVLARIHAIPRVRLPALPEQPASVQLEGCRRALDAGFAPRPVFELALRWLRERCTERAGPLALVHGDFRNGNLLVGPEGLRAVLDWEYAHLGDPMEDLAFLCLKPWRYGGHRPVGGFGKRDALYAAYERAGGAPVDPERVRFWEVLGNLKWGALCMARAARHVRGAERSVEAAAIGRRVAETELDLLELMEAGDA